MLPTQETAVSSPEGDGRATLGVSDGGAGPFNRTGLSRREPGSLPFRSDIMYAIRCNRRKGCRPCRSAEPAAPAREGVCASQGGWRRRPPFQVGDESVAVGGGEDDGPLE